MLERQLKSSASGAPSDQRPGEVVFGLPHLLGFLRRRGWMILLATVAGLSLGLAYLVVTSVAYTATTALLIDTRKLAIFSEGDVVGEAVISSANVETQVQILLSAKIAEAVATKLSLMDDADFMDGDVGLIDTIAGWFGAIVSAPSEDGVIATLPDGEALTRRAAGNLRRNLQVRREGLSFVISVSYTDGDPFRAARIANAFTDAYVEDQFNAQVATAERGSTWLLSRIQHLREQSTDEALTAQEKSAVRATYDSYLQRYTETVQQQSLPFTEARVITPAAQGGKTAPRSALILGASILLGAFLGLGGAVMRDLLDRAVRTRRQIEVATGTPFLGYLPTFKVGGLAMRRLAKQSKKQHDAEARKFAAGAAYSMVSTAPFSRFTETLRNVKVAVDRPAGQPVRVLGIVSSVANEGRSTIAVNLARLAANGGARVLLIDGDLRNPILSKDLAAEEAPGLVQVIRRQVGMADAIWTDQTSPLEFLPAGTEKATNPSEILGSVTTQAFLESCRRQYELIVVDLPAVLPVVDARAAAHLFDGFVFVVEWARTTEDMLADAFHISVIAERVLGTVFNKVNLAVLRTHDADTSAGKYMESYRHTA